MSLTNSFFFGGGEHRQKPRRNDLVGIDIIKTIIRLMTNLTQIFIVICRVCTITARIHTCKRGN